MNHSLPTPLGPYDSLPIQDKERVTTFISKDDYAWLFKEIFPQHGMQTRVTSAILYAFIQKLRQEISANPTLNPITILENILTDLNNLFTRNNI